MSEKAIAPHLEMLGTDAWQLRQFVERVKLVQDYSILSLCMTPYFAFYSVEAYDALVKEQMSHRPGLIQKFDSEIRQLRSHVKVFDGYDNGLRDVISMLEQFGSMNYGRFNKPHRGILAYLKKLLQGDLGLYFLGNKIVCTTHIAHAHIAFGRPNSQKLASDGYSNLGSLSYETSLEIGGLLAEVTEMFPAFCKATDTYSSGAFSVPPITCQDVKAIDFYTRLNHELGATGSEGIAVVFLVSQVNFVHHWLRHVFPQCNLHFRFKFLTAFHALQGLQQLGNAVSGSRERPLGRIAATVVGHKEARRFRKIGEKVRNLVAHYDIGETNITVEVPRGLSEVISQRANLPFREFDHLTDLMLESISSVFDDLLKPRGQTKVLAQKL